MGLFSIVALSNRYICGADRIFIITFYFVNYQGQARLLTKVGPEVFNPLVGIKLQKSIEFILDSLIEISLLEEVKCGAKRLVCPMGSIYIS